MDAEPVEEVKEDDGLPYWDPGWVIPYDTPEELAEEALRASLDAIRQMNEDDPWY